MTLHHGDCFDLLDQIHDETCVYVTDPPYGIEAVQNREHPNALQWGNIQGDENESSVARFLNHLSLSDNPPAVVWGANNFPQLLPFPGRWICWDKRTDRRADKMLGWPFELAWSNTTGYGIMLRCQHGGVLNVNSDKVHARRSHPTEKPVPMLVELLETLKLPKNATIVDPFAGSGSTLRAAKELGYNSIGVEIEERYCVAAERALAQETLF